MSDCSNDSDDDSLRRRWPLPGPRAITRGTACKPTPGPQADQDAMSPRRTGVVVLPPVLAPVRLESTENGDRLAGWQPRRVWRGRLVGVAQPDGKRRQPPAGRREMPSSVHLSSTRLFGNAKSVAETIGDGLRAAAELKVVDVRSAAAPIDDTDLWSSAVRSSTRHDAARHPKASRDSVCESTAGRAGRRAGVDHRTADSGVHPGDRVRHASESPGACSACSIRSTSTKPSEH